ncbi:hypothetical protein [Rhizobium sp. AAP43]|uniref:hypothetical protein n=1 Tax=Rhizobium sp. AAP43 TaxID=1523420 RepID=UPI0006B89628|nr:hypothetical protein [Rhizobium sp. AAP43]KPF43024.1 hypothetical protein IP76_14625 [Rhizobium sp. AAP43]
MSNEFHSFTLGAAAEVVGAFVTKHNDIDRLIFSWGLDGDTATGYVADKILLVAKLCAAENPVVRTENGEVPLERAFIELALSAPPITKEKACWKKLVAGLRFDGFEVDEEVDTEEATRPWMRQSVSSKPVLRRMLPEDMPGLDFREAENELEALLRKYGMSTARQHLQNAINIFSQSKWTPANAEIRNFFEECLLQIAVTFGYDGEVGASSRTFLGRLTPPFLLYDYREWGEGRDRDYFVPALMNRLSMQGSHPGLSEEDDCAFRLQVALVTARLFLRRFDRRISKDGK